MARRERTCPTCPGKRHSVAGEWRCDYCDELVRVTDAAALARIRPATFTGYVARGQAPAPDKVIADRPHWYRRTIIVWQRARPGRGWRKGRTSAAVSPPPGTLAPSS